MNPIPYPTLSYSRYLLSTRAGVAGSQGRGRPARVAVEVLQITSSQVFCQNVTWADCYFTHICTKQSVRRKRNALRALRPSLSLTRQSLIQVPSRRVYGLGTKCTACALRPSFGLTQQGPLNVMHVTPPRY